MDSLTDTQRAILDLEARWFATASGKEDAIRALGFRPVRYYQLLNAVVSTEGALKYDAVTVNRLLRVRGRVGCSAGHRGN